MSFIRRFLLLSAIFLLITVSTAIASEGFLLGVRSDGNGKNPPSCRTYWFYPSGGSYKYITGNDIIIPRSKGFWRVGVKRLEEGDWSEDLIFAVPVDKTPSLKISEDPSITSGYTHLTLLFVGPDYISFEGHTEGYTQHSAHPWSAHIMQVYSLDKIGIPVPIQKAVNDGKALHIMKKDGEKYYNSHPDEKMKLSSTPEETDWGLIRRGGKWVLRGMLNYSYEVVRGFYAFFDVSYSPPEVLTCHDNLAIPWKTIRKNLPEAIDAFSSPSGRILTVISGDYLLIYRNYGAIDYTKPLTKTYLGAQRIPVAIQWSAGLYVDRWTSSLEKILTEK